MMKKIFTIILVIFLTVNAFAQSKVLESLTMESSILDSPVKYTIYLPDGYETSSQKYPVVYLLNGFTGSEEDWTRSGNMQTIVDAEILKKNIAKMIIVMPDGDDRLYMNKEDGSYAYEDMFIKELIPFMERTYRIKSEKKFRAISGLSMGGAGSLRLALKYHEVFGACAAFSAAIMTEEELMRWDQQFYDDYFGRVSESAKGLKGKERVTKSFLEYDVFHLVKNTDPEMLKSVAILLDCGDDDFLTIGNAKLHIKFKKLGIPHEYRVRDGVHNFEYWKDSLPLGLEFINTSLMLSKN